MSPSTMSATVEQPGACKLRVTQSLDNIQCTDVGTYGLYDTNTVRLTGTGLNFTAVSQVSGTVDLPIRWGDQSGQPYKHLGQRHQPHNVLELHLRWQRRRQPLLMEYLVNRNPDAYRAYQRQRSNYVTIRTRDTRWCSAMEA